MIKSFLLFRRDIDKVEKVKAMREATKRVALGPDNLPSICFYTMLNCAETCVSKLPVVDLNGTALSHYRFLIAG